ncbi:hypothetical protein [Undibacterium sp. Ji22W]|uniref:hypothetical protein n=1 Tax=Undibacterium sp. Ji22W TaxID=3413038 RepID=UPI003BF05DCA
MSNSGDPTLKDFFCLLINQKLPAGILFAVLEFMTQLDLFGYAPLSVAEKQRAFENIRREYYWLRNLRKWKPNDAQRRRIYRKIGDEKKRLREAGVLKSEILLFLNCCRDRCKLGKECPFCRPKYGGNFRQ